MRNLSTTERRIAAGMAVAGDAAGDIGYRFGLKRAEARSLTGTNCYSVVPRVAWDADQPDEHPTLDAMFYIDHDVLHLMQGNDAGIDHFTWPLDRFDALVEAIRQGMTDDV